MSENNKLINYLSNCDKEVVFHLTLMLDSLFILKNPFDYINNVSDIPEKNHPNRLVISKDIVNLIRYYGSHNAAYYTRMIIGKDPGVDYSEILRDVLAALCKGNKKTPPKLMSVSDMETNITEIVLQKYISGKTAVELSEIFYSNGHILAKDEVNQKIKEQLSKVGTGSFLIFLVNFLGKEAIKDFIKEAMIFIIAKKAGKDAAKNLAEKIFNKISEKTISNMISGIGLSLLAWNVIDLGSTATRQTIPCIAMIAACRTIDEIK